MSSPALKHLSGALIISLLVTVLPFCTGQNTYHVKPTPDTPCHKDPCRTLTEYVNDAEHYFISNTTMVFLPGEHALQENVKVSNVGRLTLTGNPSSSPANRSRIICTNTAFIFSNTTMLQIRHLDFHSCAIQLDTSSAVFKNSSFENSTSKYGGALYAHSSIITFYGEARFDGNRAAAFGGGVYAEESMITFHGSTTFINNGAMEGGGGIYMNQSVLEFASNASFIANIVNSFQLGGGGIYGYNSSLDFDNTVVFIDNSAVTGGGIQVEYSTVNFSGDSHFVNNSAEGGGGVYIEDSVVSFGDNSEFIDNSAEIDGGGVYIEDSTVRFGDNSDFIDNSVGSKGGGVYVKHSTVSFGDNSGFTNNSAEMGGGVCVEMYSKVTLGDSSEFVDNSAELNGGGVFAWVVSTVIFGVNSEFINNSAKEGGGFNVQQSCTVAFDDNSGFINNSAEESGGAHIENSIVFFWDNCKFINNSAKQEFGGGVSVWAYSIVSFGVNNRFVNNSAGLDGGGVYVAFENTVIFGINCSFIGNSAERRGGGGYVGISSTVIFGDSSEFINNSIEGVGGGIFVWTDSTVNFGDNSGFINNSANQGGGVAVWKEGIVSFGDNSRFTDNLAKWMGGGVYVDNSTVSFGDNSGFVNNSAEIDGGGVYVEDSIVSFGDNSGFINNSVILHGGGVYVWKNILVDAVYVLDSTVTFGDNSEFINNSAQKGGGINVESGTVNFGSNSGFINNLAALGGGVYVWEDGTLSFSDNSKFINNSAELGGSGVYVERSTVSFGYSDFIGNSAGYFGGCVAAEVSTISMNSSNFMNNSARYGGCIFVVRCTLTFSEATVFSGNSASNQYSGGSGDASQYILWYGGGIVASSSNLTFGGSHILTNNSAGYGGAMYLTFDSKIYLLSNTSMSFERNAAQYRGGALFVQDDPYTYCILDSAVQPSVRAACVFQPHEVADGCRMDDVTLTEYLDQSIELQFRDNTANEAGIALYGGNLELCGVCTSHYYYVLGKIAFNIWANTSSHLMSSDPYRLCICMNNRFDCKQHSTTHEIFPGVTIVVPVVAFGQYDGMVPAVVQAYPSDGIILDDLQHTQQSNNTCSDLQYTVFARDINVWREATVTLYADEPCSTLGIPLQVFVKFLPCPLGFFLSTEGSCKCNQRLSEYEVDCDIDDQSILRKDNVWIGFGEQSDYQLQGLILHPHCPFDYCKPETDSVKFTMNNTDLQCNYNRSGHLCGTCQHGFSLAVGSSRCLPCSNKFLALFIAFILAGLALVIFLFVCKVTVAAGTISGLLFYANVVTANQSIFFPSGETNILTVFIAWLNLDLGIETCFFDGMDAYSRTWLQFVFPIYIWLLVGLITILCNVSTTAARILGGTNPIAVLATLFLLSYTKLLRTIIAAFSFTTLEYPDDETKAVWLYDGNIGYLDKNDGRHIALFLASLLVFLFLFLPYTLFLLFGQCILPRLDLNKLTWLSISNYLRMKSFLDAYYAPYKDSHRYWIGLLLVLRFAMFTVSATVDIESPQDPHVNLLVIIACNVGLAMWVWNVSGGVYKKWHLNVLESSFIFNLVILSAATYQVRVAGGNQAAVFYASVSVAFSTFIGIVIYHVYQRLRDSRTWRNLVRKRNERRRARDNDWLREDAAVDEEMEEMLPQAAPTVTYFDIPTDERREMRPITPPPSPVNVCEPPDHLPREDAEVVEVTPTVTSTPTAKALTPPPPPINFTDLCEPLDHLQFREDAVADEEVEEMLPQVTPTVTSTPTAKVSTHPPPPVNFTDLREPLDLLTQ